MAKDGCGNILGPNLTIDIDFVLEKFPEKERDHELKQVDSRGSVVLYFNRR